MTLPSNQPDLRKEYQRPGTVKPDDSYRERSKYFVQLWWIIQNTAFRWSLHSMNNWRISLLRLFGAKIGKNVLIRSSAQFTYPWKIEIGNNCRVGEDVYLYSLDKITIDDNVVISQRSYLSTGSHDIDKISFDLITAPIYIEEQVWLASDVFVLPGVRIHRGCVVGTRSTVTKDLPEGMICFGTPAKAIKQRKGF